MIDRARLQRLRLDVDNQIQQSRRIKQLEAENSRLRARVATLDQRVLDLEAELIDGED